MNGRFHAIAKHGAESPISHGCSKDNGHPVARNQVWLKNAFVVIDLHNDAPDDWQSKKGQDYEEHQHCALPVDHGMFPGLFFNSARAVLGRPKQKRPSIVIPPLIAGAPPGAREHTLPQQPLCPPRLPPRLSGRYRQ